MSTTCSMNAPQKRSMRAAINAMCKGCIYDRYQSGTWRQQVEACTSPRCPLYQFRPISDRRDAIDDDPPSPTGVDANAGGAA